MLKSLGPKVVPFVVAKLAENKDENLCGVYLCKYLFHSGARSNYNRRALLTYHLTDNELERVEEYRVNLGEALPEISLYKTRATEIVELNYQRQKLYDELMHIWKEDYLEQKLTASVHTLCVGEEYEGIIALGPSIIGSVLLEYTADRGGWWYEMLHHLIHGRTMQAHAIFGRSKLLDQWSDFFNYEEFDKAPLYIPNEWDIYILTGVKGPAVEAEHQRRGR